MAMDLYRRCRPKQFKYLFGQEAAVKTLESLLAKNDLPHCLVFCGPSGVGKTTAARILKRELGCSDDDYEDVNCAALESPLDTIREIKNGMNRYAIAGKDKPRIWVLDECQSLSRAGFSQQALLKVLEECPSHIYFILCTTEPGKLIGTIHTRCCRVDFKPVGETDLHRCLDYVEEKIGKRIGPTIADKIVNEANGSPRQAIVLLQKVLGIESEQAQLEAITKPEAEKHAIDLCRVLIDPKKRWDDVKVVLENLNGEDPESVRRAVLGYASSVVMGGGKLAGLAYHLISAFEGNFYDSGRAGIVRACWEVRGLVNREK